MPEAAGLSLEEMGVLFGDTVVTHMTTDDQGHVGVEAVAEFKGEERAVEIDHARGYKDSKVGAHHTTTMTGSDRPDGSQPKEVWEHKARLGVIVIG